MLTYNKHKDEWEEGEFNARNYVSLIEYPKNKEYPRGKFYVALVDTHGLSDIQLLAIEENMFRLIANAVRGGLPVTKLDASTSACCSRYNNTDSYMTNSFICEGCPIKNDTEKAHCINTPYSNAVIELRKHTRSATGVVYSPASVRSTTVKALLKQADYLKELITKLKKED